MANIFRAKHIISRTGTFSHEVTAPNLVYNTGNQTISGLKDFNNQINVSGIKFDLLTGNDIPPTYQDGLMWYDDDAKGLKFYNDSITPLTIGQEEIVRGTNDLGFQLNKGQVVYITGAGGGGKFPGFQLSIANGEGGSARTLGVISENILNNGKGYAVSFGRLEGIDTNSYNVGQVLYLSWEHSGAFTGVKPKAPNHLVRVGTVLRKGNAGNGVIFVNIQNGFEMDELHDVNINSSYTLNNNDILRYNTSSGLWFNQSLNTGVFQDQINSLSGAAVLKYGNQDITGIKTFINNQIFSGNIGVSGTGVFNALDLNNIDNLTLSGIEISITGSTVNVFNNILISGNPVLTGVDLSSYATISNLASTGSTLQTNIDNLSGYINSSNSNVVFTTGNQLINGTKTFTGITTFSGQEVNLVDIALNLSGVGDMTFSGTNINFINSPVFISGTNLRVSGDIYGYNIYSSGAQVLTGVDLSNYATKSLAIAYAIAL